MRCDTCGGTDICVVTFETASGATYHYCRYCDAGWWNSGGTGMATANILKAAASIAPGKRRRS